MRIDPASTGTRDIYRVMIRCIVPRPIAWVSTRSADGQLNLSPFSFFTGVTSDPPSVLFCPGRRGESGSRKDTLTNVEATGELSIAFFSFSVAIAHRESSRHRGISRGCLFPAPVWVFFGRGCS